MVRVKRMPDIFGGVVDPQNKENNVSKMYIQEEREVAAGSAPLRSTLATCRARLRLGIEGQDRYR